MREDTGGKKKAVWLLAVALSGAKSGRACQLNANWITWAFQFAAGPLSGSHGQPAGGTRRRQWATRADGPVFAGQMRPKR